MAYLVDTSILARLANLSDPQRPLADRAVQTLLRRGEVLRTTAQVFVEFRNVATRPVAVNGLGLTAATAEQEAAKYEMSFPLLDETASLYPTWKALVHVAGVIGKQVHDARLVAVCHVNTISHLLTFNTAHFARLSGFGAGLIVVHPSPV